jgi:acetyl esterase
MNRITFQRSAARAVDGFFTAISAVGRTLPAAKPIRHGVECLPDIEYGPLGKAHQLDIYRPIDRTGPLPVVLYIHGGGFRSLSKDSHWLMALVFAKKGYLVVNINYRLAPRHPYPAAIQDVCLAWLWALEKVAQYGGDPTRMAVAGESAGANLAVALTVACCYRRPEPWTHAVFETGVVPKVIAPACGVFQVSNIKRLLGTGDTNRFSQAVLDDCEYCYLPESSPDDPPGLADPVCIIEQEAPTRPLPPAFLPVGGWDPLKSENHRMSQALINRGAETMERLYPREVHAFHAFVFRKQARQCWQEMLKFMNERV